MVLGQAWDLMHNLAHDAGETIKILAPVATAGAAWFAAMTAFDGLTKWRKEAIWKSNTELSEEVLSRFLQARDKFRFIRSRTGYAPETEGRKPQPSETREQAEERDSYFPIVKRLQSENGFMRDLLAKQYIMRAKFGPAAELPFSLLEGALGEVG